LPLYELALQTAHAVPGADVRVVTPEPAPLAAFGPEVAAEVAQLLAVHGVGVRTDTPVQEHAGGRLWLDRGSALVVDRVVALPRLVGPHVRGVPADPLGFVPVDDFTRALDADRVHAVGDVAAHGVKQGGLAAQQADVAAQVIAAAAGAGVVPEPFRPVLRGVLICGDDVRYLRHDPADGSAISEELLWWPPHKVAGRHLAHYLARRATFAHA
jgi:sulfide:quinone oxidoreductase